MIPVKVLKIKFHHKSRSYAVLLGEVTGNRTLPIMVGACEAHSIASALEFPESTRPIMTHDLINTIITEIKAKISSVQITDLIDGVFYARVEIEGLHIGLLNLDLRPSDAIAIALRTDSPIFIDESIIKEGKNIEVFETVESNVETINSKKSDLEYKLKKAVEMEKYEEAAIIRDKLKDIK